jgi:hypothetical protein
MASTNDTSDEAEDLQVQIARLREQVEALMKSRVTPSVESLAGQIQDQPLIAILIAATVGWIIGRMMR